VSQDRATIHISFFPGSGIAEMPPFWELEALIDRGLKLDLALDVMATRRIRGLPASVRVSEIPIAEEPPTLINAHP